MTRSDTRAAGPVAVVGPGAIGATFAAVLHQAGVPVRLCGRGELASVTVRPDGQPPIVLADGVHTDPATLRAEAPAGWVLLAVKDHQTEAASGWLRVLCGPDTVVVVLRNGVEHRERVAPFTGPASVLPAIVWCPAEVVSPGMVRLRGAPRLTVPDEPAGHRLARLLGPGGAVVEIAADFRTELWHKLAVNAVAGLMVLAGRRAGMFRRPDVRALGTALARECIEVGNAEGARLPPSLAEQITQDLADMPADMGSSILFDRMANRPLEWDPRNGVVSRFGARHGIATPISDVLVPLLAAASDVEVPGW